MDLELDDLIHGESRRYIPEEYFDLKTRIHDRLLDMVDLTVVENLDEQTLRSQIRVLVERIIREDPQNIPLNLTEREAIITEIQDEVLGFGPLEPFLKDPTVSDILVNTLPQHLCGTLRQDGGNRGPFQRQPASDEGHR